MASTSTSAPIPKTQEGPRRRADELRKFLSAPGIFFLVVVTQIPFALTIYYSFTNWNLLRPGSEAFLGLERMWLNYSRILNNPDFFRVLSNTLILTLSVVAVTFVLGMMFALLMNRPFFGRGLARTMLISPFLVMPVAAAVLWKNLLLDPSFGLSAWVMRLGGVRGVSLLQDYPMATIVAVVSWQWTPFVMLILLAGLQSLPDSTREAAWLDGAGPVAMFCYITLPHLKRFIEIALLLEVIFILNVFGEIFVMTGGGPGIQTTNLPYQIFLEAFSRWNIGRASAYGLFAIILANLVVLMFLQVLRRGKEEGAA